MRDCFTSHKLNLKEPSPSNWIVLTSFNGIAHIEKALDGDTDFIMLNDGARRLKKVKWEITLA
jgi:hypothetical protein